MTQSLLQVNRGGHCEQTKHLSTLSEIQLFGCDLSLEKVAADVLLAWAEFHIQIQE
jgi:hypothetical protein